MMVGLIIKKSRKWLPSEQVETNYFMRMNTYAVRDKNSQKYNFTINMHDPNGTTFTS